MKFKDFLFDLWYFIKEKVYDFFIHEEHPRNITYGGTYDINRVWKTGNIALLLVLIVIAIMIMTHK